MASQIDPTLPVLGAPQTKSVRNNFAIAATEISALQAATPVLTLWIDAPGVTVIPDGTGKVFVNVEAPVTLTLPLNDVSVMDRGPNAGTYPITCNAPAGMTINGNSSFVMIGNWASARFYFDGTNYALA